MFTCTGPLLNADLRNEPSLVIPWEYDYVGAPHKTQSVIRKTQQQLFTATPTGIPGNDDLGTMSAWYVFSALGFYPVTPGTRDLALGSAVFPQAKVHLPAGKTLTITAPQASTAHPYISSMTVNGATWTHAYLPSELVTEGGTVEQALSPTANTSFGTAAEDAPPSDTTGLAAALGFTTSSQILIQPGGTGSLTLGARNLLGQAQDVSWSITSTGGLTVTPSSGTLLLAAHGDGTRQVSVKAPAVSVKAPATEGRQLVTITYRSGTGAAMPTVTSAIDVAKPGALWPFFNNAGIASDGVTGSADFDGYGWAYSSQQLAAVGVTPGGTLAVNGIRFTMSSTELGAFDNIEARGQSIPISATHVSKIGFLGSASNVLPGASIQPTVHFSDGSTQTVTVSLSDWTLGAGSATGPAYGNRIVAKTPYRIGADGRSEQVTTYLFEADVALSGGRTVTSVTLPALTGNGRFHVFAIGTA